MINNTNPLKNYNWWSNIDKLILISTLLLLLFGVISMSSINQHFEGKFYFSHDLLLKKHLIFCIIGLVIIFVLSQFSLKHAIYLSLFIFVLSIVLCVAAIFFSPETKGANRWIKFYNFSFQPSELFKPSFIILSAVLLGRYKIKNDYSFFLNILCLIIISSLLILQPDFGMFILIFAVWLIQILSSNINLKIIIPIVLSFILVFLLCFFTLEHVKFRIMNFFFSEVGDNYQISKSLDSFENGGLFGKGIGEGTVAKNLPDVHSDFIFALIGEELGGFSAILIIGVYIAIYIRIHIISQRSKNFFIVTALTGLANIFIFQVIINISSSLNIIPTKGMTLPFISYGGSSFISSSIIVGFILLLIKEEKNAK